MSKTAEYVEQVKDRIKRNPYAGISGYFDDKYRWVETPSAAELATMRYSAAVDEAIEAIERDKKAREAHRVEADAETQREINLQRLFERT